ncbi:aminotransferase class I/II-fold pyridoxal phosphate-dependent enzyme [Streptomyces canus]|uniref:aminotransferase class I/II-fold pyridoxal phosphate-dependent enzyme n=1 Tax=Streptomyces canus TaxID=58343 RepID=UPI00224FB989|nr:aminotransferase class I/II-fold pyridoxal phosphate-dependent enzyme [Streptomyces canus]MCX4854906.1 aminotransferase class I/II-fold pyridoxal phosphate-dependent enzyme [Streptomyces canus]WSW39691.1 aminotransferase class I/II-fold pyridoxal phosphate-dependent enzyme [Streptomyces canus]
MTNATGNRQHQAGVHRQVVEIVASCTLYDESYLLPDSHFEADLGIDSVILESVLASVSEHFALPTPLTAGPATIRELVDAVTQAVGGGAVGLTDLHAVAPEDGDDLLEKVVAVAQRHTQYQRHQLAPDADFESELGIDSVVLAAIIADVSRALGLADGLMDSVTATSLRGLVTELRSAQERKTPADRVPSVDLAPSSVPEAGTGPAEDAPEWDGRSMKDFVEERSRDLFAKARSFGTYLRRREAEQLYWYGMPLHSRCGSRAVIFDELVGREREFLMFASNNYLGLANHPKVIEAVCEATRTYGATHTGSRFIGGTNVLHKELERRLAAFKQRPACIVYPGGYAANLGAISALVKSYDTLVVDRLNHMSIVDGARLSGGVRKIYQHNDMADLERILKRADDRSGGRLVVADGVFSMHGDICDLPEIVRLAKEYDARIMIDDAHATGVLGERGSGTTEHFGLKGEVDLELGTMSKALAGMGGFVVGDEAVIEYLRFYSNSYVFAANIPAGVAAGLIASIDVIESEPERITELWSNIRLLRGQLADAGFDLENTQSAILPIVIGDERKAMEMGRAVRARGLYCQTVVFPGVPLGDARLRVSVTSEHTREDLENAAGIFVEAAREVGVLPSAA